MKISFLKKQKNVIVVKCYEAYAKGKHIASFFIYRKDRLFKNWINYTCLTEHQKAQIQFLYEKENVRKTVNFPSEK